MKGNRKFYTLLVLLAVFISGHSMAQNPVDDLVLIEQNNVTDPVYDDYKPTYMFKESRAIVKYSPPAMAFGLLMFGYQNLLSVQLSSNCLYTTSCSRFSIGAIKEYGIIKGVMLSADRLSRCNQISGIDAHPLRIDQKTGHVHDDLDYFKKRK